MPKHLTDDLRIQEIKEVLPPEVVHTEHALTDAAAETTWASRQAVHNILHGEDDRLIVIMGPCSIHDPEAALAYAANLKTMREALADDLEIIMRVYFEKPRTTVGWKGLINDPNLDGSFEINKGLCIARKLLLELNNLGIPAGTEFLDLVTPQYFADLISWGAIGARTTESQVHRELASGLSCPVGFKNGTDGALKVAIDAIRAGNQPHHFLSLTKSGRSAIFSTSGNQDCHLILRGGKKPNYDSKSINDAAQQLEEAGLEPKLMVDFSHANCEKQYHQQMNVGENISNQIASGESRITGVMVESHINEDRQDIVPGKPLEYGKSITDACLGWDDSAMLLKRLAQAVRDRRNIPAAAVF